MREMDWWIWLLLIVALLAVGGVGVSLWRSRAGRSSASMGQRPARSASDYVPDQRVKELPAPDVPEADDLAAIEGIGPRIHDVLHDAGVTTFALLADTKVERLVEILGAAELPFTPNPETWPAQARLAAQSRWAELRALQESLKAGEAN